MLDMKDITSEDILAALAIIKTVCYNNICSQCPFGGDLCNIKISDPEDWEIEFNPIWRAFK